MKIHRIVVLMLASSAAFAFDAQSELVANLADTEKKIVSLAEAMPADKYSWRPMEGVRSVGEVYMHIAGANYMIPAALGAKAPAGISRDMEKTVTDKAKIIEQLKQSFAHVRQAIESSTDNTKATKLFGRDNTHGGVKLLIITHLHEHLGQSIAYARTNKVTPPWSAGRD
jgi:uncharacterized damage-inducible protein DinB